MRAIRFFILLSLLLLEIGECREPQAYFRSQDAMKKLEKPNGRFCFWYNPQLWNPEPVKEEEWHGHHLQEISFKSADPDLYATLLVEEAPLSGEESRRLIAERTHYSFYNIRLIFQEMRQVNGTNVDCYLWKGNYQGTNKNLVLDAPYYFYIYYFRGKTTLQLSTYCLEEDFFQTHDTQLRFLSGMILNCP